MHRTPWKVKMTTAIPSQTLPGWPVFDDEQIAAVERVLRSGKVNYWTGEEVRKFEEEYAAALGVRHAIAVANGTVALELALFALDIGPGDEVVVPSRTFVASASAVVARGATPVIADLDPDSQNLTARTVAKVLSPRTRAIIAVHLAGWPCEMDDLREFAKRHELYVIEDCAQAHGATYRGRPVGTFGDINAFSFCQDKILTTGGEGGLVTTDETSLWEKAWSYKDHGKSWDAVHNRQHTGSFKYLHESFGTNWRLTEMQAALGRVQLRRLPEWSTRRRQNAACLAEQLAPIPGLRIPEVPQHLEHACYKFYAFIRPEHLAPGWSRDRIVEAIQSRGIFCGCGSCAEIYREKAFSSAGLGPRSPLPVAHELQETSLMFQIHPTLEPAHIKLTADIAREVLGEALVSSPAIRARAA
ncbi:MAG: DegT/DnrJ/EryC1/StrS aminotransferase family protein [Planctomycetaceae bacterium]|nr:DegT/DnrJ/EryC1/StrS aminotransferase family protein [Planctomycetaceae bacterium]